MMERIVDRFSVDILSTVGEKWPQVVLAVLKSALLVLPNVIKELRQDDIIDTQVLGYDLMDKDACFLPRQYLLSGRGGKYKVVECSCQNMTVERIV
jgi:hypothetical protein